MYNENDPPPPHTHTKENFVKGSMSLVIFWLGLFYYQALNIPKKKKRFSFSLLLIIVS